jgi:hypothetical protein
MNESATQQQAHQLPMTFGQIFDRTYRLMRDNLRLFMGIAAVPCVAIVAVLAAVIGLMFMVIGPQIANETAKPPGIPLLFWAVLICVYLILPFIYALYLPAASYAATRADIGVATTFREAYSVAWRRYGRHLWLMILGTLYMLAPVVVCLVVIGLGALLLQFAMGSGSSDNSALMLIPLAVLLYIASLVCSILITLRISLAYPACVVEKLTAWNSLQRSIRLTKGAMGRIFLMLLVVYAFTYLVSLVCIAVLCIVGALVALVAILVHVAVGSVAFYILIGLAVLGYLLTLMVTCLFSYAAFTTALAILYYDQRLRKDGLMPVPEQAVDGRT